MKYQLTVYWKNGTISGRIVDIPWRLAPLSEFKIDRVELEEAEESKATDQHSGDARG